MSSKKRYFPKKSSNTSFFLKNSFKMAVVISLLVFLVIAVFSLSSTSRMGVNLKNTSAAAEDFLTVSGRALSYRGQTVYLRGANIHNTPWDNGWRGNVNNIIITEADYQKLAQMGGNHFRFGITVGMWKYTKDQFYQMMDRHISWARKHNVWIVLNSFSTPNDQESSGWRCNDLASQEQALGDFWVDVATRYRNEPVIAGYDIINEPGWCNGWDYWFNMAERIGRRINQTSPNQLVFISSNDGGTFSRRLNVANAVYEMHHYEPGGGTHCQASTRQFTYPGVMSMWGGDPNTYWSRETMAAPFNGSNYASLDYNIPTISWSQQQNVPLYIGEWGMASPLCVGGAGAYEADTGRLFIQRGLHHAYYVWRHNPTYWGIFPHEQGNFTPNFQEKFDAAVVSFANSVRPNFGGGPVNTSNPSPTPTATTTPPSTPVVTLPPSGGTFSISRPLQLDRTTVGVGQVITGSIIYKNNSSSPVTLEEMVIAGRPPGGTNLNGPYLDFSPKQGSVTVQPGQSVTLTASRTIGANDPKGQWYAFGTYRANGRWTDAPSSQNVVFTVGTTPTATGASVTSVTISAAGTPANGVYPVMGLYVNNILIRRFDIRSTTLETYSAQVNPLTDISLIKITFENDFNGGSNNDRNLQVESIRLGNTTYQTVSPSTYSVGTWTQVGGCGGGNKRSQWLHCNGYFIF